MRVNQVQWPEELPAYIGNHRVLAPLSVGHETDVLLALTRGPHGFSRPVVLKRLRPDCALDPAHLRALAREAMAYARLTHPSIVRLYEFSEHEGQCLLVLEYVNGMNLRELIAQLHVRGEVMSDDVAFYVMAQVFSALAAAHAARDPATGEFASVIHRDVTPKNVLVDWDGAVKLTDFGIAKLAGVSSDTRAGLLKGTYGYMAPEQVLGDPTTVRTDVYAACLLLRELLLGRRTFVRRDMPELEFLQAMADPHLQPVEELRSGIPPRVSRALRIGLEPNPDRRDIACAEIRDVLHGAADMEKARQALAVLLQELRPTQSTPLLEQGEATEPQSWEGPVSMPREPERVSPTSGVRRRESEAQTTDAQPPAQPDAPPSAARRSMLPTVPEIHVSTAPSAFRVSAGARRSRLWRRAAMLAGAVCPLLFLAALLLGSDPQRPAQAAVRSASAAGAMVLATAPARPNGSVPSETISRAAAVRLPAASVEGSTNGAIVTLTSSHDHRIYVDGQVAGETGEIIEVRCGRHQARYGSKGRWQIIDVPCGGQYVLSPRW
jgi:serine/threonine-protein kinase